MKLISYIIQNVLAAFVILSLVAGCAPFNGYMPEVSKCTLEVKDFKYFQIDRFGNCKDKRHFCLHKGEAYSLGAYGQRNKECRQTDSGIAAWLIAS